MDEHDASWEPLQSRSFALHPRQLVMLEALRVERGLRSVGEALRLVIDGWFERETEAGR